MSPPTEQCRCEVPRKPEELLRCECGCGVLLCADGCGLTCPNCGAIVCGLIEVHTYGVEPHGEITDERLWICKRCWRPE